MRGITTYETNQVTFVTKDKGEDVGPDNPRITPEIVKTGQQLLSEKRLSHGLKSIVKNRNLTYNNHTREKKIRQRKYWLITMMQKSGGNYVPSTYEMKHVDEVLKLMSVLTNDNRFQEIRNDLISRRRSKYV